MFPYIFSLIACGGDFIVWHPAGLKLAGGMRGTGETNIALTECCNMKRDTSPHASAIS